MKKWIQDLVLGIVLLVFSVVSFVYAYIMQNASAKYFSARADTYILLWTGILGILSVALIVRSLRQRPSEPAPQIVTKRVLMTVVIIALYIALPETLGFIVSSVLMLLSLLLFFTLEAQGKAAGKGIAETGADMSADYRYYGRCRVLPVFYSSGRSLAGGYL